MSLEQAITDHAGALRELAAAIRSTIGTAQVQIASAAHELTVATDKVIADAKKTDATTASSASGAKPQTTAPKASAQGGEAKKPGASTQSAELENVSASPSDTPTYEDVKAKVLALSKDKGRDALVALLQRHGVTKAPDLKDTQYGQIIADVDAIMAGTYDPEASEELA